MDHLIISGGGINGISFIGCLCYLHDNNLLSDLKKITGSSIGSIIGLLYQVGYDPIEMKDIFESYSWKGLIDPDFNILTDNYSGIIKGKKIIDILSLLLEKKGLDCMITMKEFYEKTNIEFFITGVNCNTKKTEYFSYIDYPDMFLLKAIRISISIPLIFKSVIYNDNIFIDGSILEKLPLEKCIKEEKNFIISYKRKQGNGIINNLSLLLQYDNTDCDYPIIKFEEISYSDNFTSVLLNCFIKTREILRQKII